MNILVVWWIVGALAFVLVLTTLGVFQLYDSLRKERFRNRSLSTKYGKLTEQFLPLVESYPWDPNRFRFLGSPLDGIQFEDDRIIFIEFKAGDSQLSKQQKQIRNLVEKGRVEFEVIRVG